MPSIFVVSYVKWIGREAGCVSDTQMWLCVLALFPGKQSHSLLRLDSTCSCKYCKYWKCPVPSAMLSQQESNTCAAVVEKLVQTLAAKYWPLTFILCCPTKQTSMAGFTSTFCGMCFLYLLFQNWHVSWMWSWAFLLSLGKVFCTWSK